MTNSDQLDLLLTAWRWSSPILELGCGTGEMTPYLAQFIAPAESEVVDWKRTVSPNEAGSFDRGEHSWPRYWAADGIQRLASIAQMWFAFFCRRSRGYKATQMRKVKFMATELIHHIGGSWRAQYLASTAF
jgi:hypothetical protein